MEGEYSEGGEIHGYPFSLGRDLVPCRGIQHVSTDDDDQLRDDRKKKGIDNGLHLTTIDYSI